MSSSDLDLTEALETWLARAEKQAVAEATNPQLAVQRHADERQRIRVSAIAMLRESKVPLKLQAVLIDNELRESTSIAKTRSWMRTQAWCLILSSTYSVGKSQAMAWWLYESLLAFMEARRGAPLPGMRCWFSASALCRVDKFRTADFETLANLQFLCIDDLGAEFSDRNGAWLSFLGDLINERQANDRKTFITTNLNADEFKNRYEARIIERIRGGGVFAGVTGPNLRRPDAEKDMPLAGVDAPHRNEPAEREGRFVVNPAQYRLHIRSPRAEAKRRQLALPFNQVA